MTGKTLGENTAGAECYNREVIASIDAPLKEEAGIAVLRGNLCPDGAIIKPSAASPELLQHRGRAVVFESIEDYKARVDDPDLDVDKDCVLVLKGIGPRGFPGMPEEDDLAMQDEDKRLEGLGPDLLFEVLELLADSAPITSRRWTFRV